MCCEYTAESEASFLINLVRRLFGPILTEGCRPEPAWRDRLLKSVLKFTKRKENLTKVERKHRLI